MHKVYINKEKYKNIIWWLKPYILLQIFSLVTIIEIIMICLEMLFWYFAETSHHKYLDLGGANGFVCNFENRLHFILFWNAFTWFYIHKWQLTFYEPRTKFGQLVFSLHALVQVMYQGHLPKRQVVKNVNFEPSPGISTFNFN